MGILNLTNKKGVSKEFGLIITAVIIFILIITLFFFLKDSGSGIKDLIRTIFG